MKPITDPQSLASLQGRRFETLVADVFEMNGWTITETRMKHDHVEIDLVVVSPDNQTWWVECKGSWRGLTPGLMRADTMKKALAVAYHLHHGATPSPPYVIVTTHKPRPMSSACHMLQRAIDLGAVHAVIEPNDIRLHTT